MKLALHNVQLEICHDSKTDRAKRRYKTDGDIRPWLTTVTGSAFRYHFTMMRKILDEDNFLKKKIHLDIDRRPSLFPEYPPPTPHVVLANLAEYQDRATRMRYRAPFRQKDTPLRALYRIYEHVIMDNNIGMRIEIEYFWHRHTWTVHKIPDPKDPDPARYAMLAGVSHLLVLAFNRLVGIGLPRGTSSIIYADDIEKLKSQIKKWERLPKWATRVPPLKDTLRIPAEGSVLEDYNDPRAADYLREKNILLLRPHIYFI